MRSHYNAIAGTSVERLAALSDGAFAIAMTLLVLDLRAPAAEAVRSEWDLVQGLQPLLPRLLVYFMTFLTLGIFWLGQQTVLSFLRRASRGVSWIHIIFLFSVSLAPFLTQLLAEFILFRFALLLYWLNILVLGILLFAAWAVAKREGLLKAEATPQIDSAIRRRILGAQGLYALGLALSLFGTPVSVAWIVLVQLYFAVSPRLPFQSR